MATAYESWSSAEKERYNPDGTMKEEAKNRLLAKGKSILDIFSMESRKQEEVQQFEEREQWFQEQYGITYSEWSRPSESSAQRNKRQRLALQEGADISELPDHMEPDEYYDYHAGYPA